MSEGANNHRATTPGSLGERSVIKRLLGWGELLESLLAGLMPSCTLEEFWRHEFLRDDLEQPLKDLADIFGPMGEAEVFLRWWLGLYADLPGPLAALSGETQPSEQDQIKFNRIELAVRQGIRAYLRSWSLAEEHVLSKSNPDLIFSVRLNKELLAKLVEDLDGDKDPDALSSSLEEAIVRVRSFFEPLETSLFGMTNELLAQHVQETIPRGVLGESVPPIIPLFGKHQLHRRLSALVELPVHLRVILRRIDYAQASGEFVNELLAYLEAIDFSLRFATGLAQGCLSAIKDGELPGSFSPTTRQIIVDLASCMGELGSFWDHPHAQAAIHLLMKGEGPHSFLTWAGIDGSFRLLTWMVEAEVAVREDNPARSSALAEEVSEIFGDWLREFVLLCSAWDVTLYTRQDGYLGINVARGQVSINCKPLIDATRYAVWIDRSELALFSLDEAFHNSKQNIEQLDSKALICSGDPAMLDHYVLEFARAQGEEQVLAMGHALFSGIEYLLRLNVSLNGGFLLNCFEDLAILDSVLKPGGTILHCIYFLSFSQGVFKGVDRPEAQFLRSVFFDKGGAPRRISRWLGVDGDLPSPLQGLVGWSLSLIRPDAINRIRDIGDGIPKLFHLFKEFIEASRPLWTTASLRIEVFEGGAQAVVCQFPSGLRVRGKPDVVVGYRVLKSLQGVVVGEKTIEDPLFNWEQADEPEAAAPESKTEHLVGASKWPSFFEEPDPESTGKISWDPSLERELAFRIRAQAYSSSQGTPTELVRAIADFITSSPPDTSTVSFIMGKEGSGRTLLCRTLVQPKLSGLSPDFPILYFRVDRYPKTRTSIVIERVNDHIASEPSLDSLKWVAVPNEVLQSMGSELDRLSIDFAEFGPTPKRLANRLSTYLRYLKKLNGEREFLLILDGFELVPESVLPAALVPGVHLLITGSSFPPLDIGSSHLRHKTWDLSADALMRASFARVIAEIHDEPDSLYPLFSKLDGSMLKAHAYVNVCENLSDYRANPGVLEDLLTYARRIFPDSEQRESFNSLLCILGLYAQPVSLSLLRHLGVNVEVANVATDSLPALFSFWSEPEPSIELAHESVFSLLLESGDKVHKIANSLFQSFMLQPQPHDILLALRWVSFTKNKAELIEQLFAKPETLAIWRQELARLWDRGLYFKRVALLDATEGPMLAAVEAGVGDLREELGWLYNARGLSLLKLGLLTEAKNDLDKALESFRTQFASGEMSLISSVGSATNRLSELALKSQDAQLATRLSQAALEVLHEGRSLADPSHLCTLTVVAQIQMAKVYLYTNEFAQALAIADAAKDNAESFKNWEHRHELGKISLLRAEALSGLEDIESALSELNVAIELLLKSRVVEDGIQALILRSRLLQRLGYQGRAYKDLEHALSILRYQIFRGRIDFEPLAAFVAARRALMRDGRPEDEVGCLEEFIFWATHAVRFEGRFDLRALLAYLLMARADCRKDIGIFAPAVEDLRLATEQYDLLASQFAGSTASRMEQESVWRGLCVAYADMAALYLALDEAPLVLLAGRRALELAAKGRVDGAVFEGSIDVSNFSFMPLALEISTGDIYESESYRMARLVFCLGEAARRLKLEQVSMSYLEQAVYSYERLFAEWKSFPKSKIEEYRQVVKQAAKGFQRGRDFINLRYWADKLWELSVGEQYKHDHIIIHCWRAQSKAGQGYLEEAQQEYEIALELLEASPEHPFFASFQAEILFNLGRVFSLKGKHGKALQILYRGFKLAEDAFSFTEDGSDELVERGILHLAVAYLRAGNSEDALNKLRLLASHRPSARSLDFEQLTDDWVTSWQNSSSIPVEDLLSCLDSMCQLGDWLLCTSLGVWFRELVTKFVNHQDFSRVLWDSVQLDRVAETFLIVVFPQFKTDRGYRGRAISDTGELQRLLEAKYRTLRTEGKLVEAELVVSHLLEHKMTPSSGKFLLLRSEMALKRGDRGMALVDLLRATDSYGGAKVYAHLRLAEFLYARELMAASVMHLRRCLFSMDGANRDYGEELARVEDLLTGLASSEVQLEPEIIEEYLRICKRRVDKNGRLRLDSRWLKALVGYREWPHLLDLSVAFIASLQELGYDCEQDWEFLDGVLECTVLSTGGIPRLVFRDLGELLALSYIKGSSDSRAERDTIWSRFARLLPALGRHDSLAILQRLFQLLSGMEGALEHEQVRDFLTRLEEEVRLLN